MRCSWLRSVGAYFDSPQHHEGDVVEVRELSTSTRLAVVKWRAEWEDEGGPKPILMANLVLWSERHLEPA